MKILTFLLLGTSALGADYENALSLSARTENLVFRDRLKPNWLPDGKSFWYRVQSGAKTHDFVLIDAERGTRKMAASLKELGLPEQTPIKSSATSIELRRTLHTGGESSIRFINQLATDADLFWINSQGEHVRYGSIRAATERKQHTFEGHVWLVTEHTGAPLAVVEAEAAPQAVLIDGKGVSKKATEKRREEEHGFQSPDGEYRVEVKATPVARRRITLVDSSPKDSLQPGLKVIDYLKPGDPLPNPEVIVTARDGRKIRLSKDLYPTPFSESGEIAVSWAPDGREFTFDYNQRGHQLYRILAANPKTGAVRVVVEETSNTTIDYTQKTWRHWLHETGELLWMSERDGWCHLWLYDARTGGLKNQVTRGNWPVRQVLHVDAVNRTLWFLASGLRAEEDPYHLHLCRVNLDGSGFQQLTQGDGTHQIEFSPNRDFFTAAYSRADQPPVNELRRSSDGSLVCVLEKADASQLLSAGWTLPERFVAKGRDGQTDIHGVLVKPSTFDPAKKYPVIEEIYAGPHSNFAPKAFGRLLNLHILAELGFIVVKLDGMGTNHRGKAFRDVSWKNLKDAGFPDRIAWIKAAAATRPWMDLNRVGIYGGSAGGQNAMRALLDHHDFYHVAVADCGCHDNRMDKIWWNEQWMGWPIDDSYRRSSNREDAHKLQGHLLLMVGELDTNVDPASTTQVVGALQKAGKAFDFMPIAGAGHGAAETPYGSRLRMDFFVRHLKP